METEGSPIFLEDAYLHVHPDHDQFFVPNNQEVPASSRQEQHHSLLKCAIGSLLDGTQAELAGLEQHVDFGVGTDFHVNGHGIQLQHLVSLEARPIVLEDRDAVGNRMHAEQVLVIIAEEDVFAMLSEGEGAVSADPVSELAAGEEREEEVHRGLRQEEASNETRPGWPQREVSQIRHPTRR